MTREKYESLPLSTLKEVAKTRGLRGISTMKKADLIDLMLEEDDKVSIKEAKEEVKSEKAGTAEQHCNACYGSDLSDWQGTARHDRITAESR